MSITVTLTNGIIPTSNIGLHMTIKQVWQFLHALQVNAWLCQGANPSRPLAFDKETWFDLFDCSADDGFIVQIKKTRWMRRSKVLNFHSVLRKGWTIKSSSHLFAKKEHLDLISQILNINWFSLPAKVVCSLEIGVGSGNAEGKRHWKQALESPLTPCTKWYSLNWEDLFSDSAEKDSKSRYHIVLICAMEAKWWTKISRKPRVSSHTLYQMVLPSLKLILGFYLSKAEVKDSKSRYHIVLICAMETKRWPICADVLSGCHKCMVALVKIFEVRYKD